MGRNRYPRVAVAMDFGGSMSKIIAKLLNHMWSLNMEPEVMTVSSESIEHYQSNKLGQAEPADRAWVKVGGEYYAVGFLARNQFLGNPGLNQLKYELAWLKVLAAVWVVKEKFGLGNQLKLALACLLPPGEYEDRDSFAQILAKSLASFETPSGQMNVTLEEFNCKPEGAGVFMLHRYKRKRELRRKVAAVVTVGYRNANVMVSRRGEVGEYQTTDLGMVKMVKGVMKRTSGQSLESLSTAIAKAGEEIAPEPLMKVLRSKDPIRAQEELASLREAIRVERQAYIKALTSRLGEILPNDLDEVVLAGGTADYVASALAHFLAKVQVFWHAEVEYPPDLDTDEMGSRLADVWCIYCYFMERLAQTKFFSASTSARSKSEKKVVVW